MEKYNIVLATNNARLVRNFKEVLPRKSFSLETLNTTMQLNKVFRKKGEILEVMILDLTLPADSINRVIFYIKQFNKNIPVLLLHVDLPLIKEREVFRNLAIYGCVRSPDTKIEAEKILNDLNNILDLDMDKKIGKVDYLAQEKVFACTFKNGKTYFLNKSDVLGDDVSKIRNCIIDTDEYHFTVYLESGKDCVIPWDFILSMCEEKYEFYRSKPTKRISSEEIGERIKKIRLEKDLTQMDLEAKTGILRANIARIEIGTHYPSLETLEKIADAFEIPVSKIIVSQGNRREL